MISKLRFGCRLPCSSRVKETDLGFQVESQDSFPWVEAEGVVPAVRTAEDISCRWQVITLESRQD